jgi:hypothetical protein
MPKDILVKVTIKVEGFKSKTVELTKKQLAQLCQICDITLQHSESKISNNTTSQELNAALKLLLNK